MTQAPDPTADEERTEDVRLTVYEGFARAGRAPGTAELADRTGLTPAQVRQAFQRLQRSRDIVLDPKDDERIVMAHPFSAVPLGFSVMGSHTLWWGGCAWDAFAVPHLLGDEQEVLVATRCPACGAPHAWAVGRDAPPPGGQVAHFLVPVHRIWDDVVHACGNQRLFCSVGCVDDWLTATGQERGYVMDLATLWRLARGWYAGRMDRGYRRREPLLAAAYFAEVGLRGPFWGLPAD
ncbi:organomercurial lyase [Streptomyces sp. NPDC020681]|uniref:organomercurial lyase n=1 Tax=Streptomyces sp. NPDC020681 TaxID=3365083 RepID=UPI00378BC230